MEEARNYSNLTDLVVAVLTEQSKNSRLFHKLFLKQLPIMTKGGLKRFSKRSKNLFKKKSIQLN